MADEEDGVALGGRGKGRERMPVEVGVEMRICLTADIVIRRTGCFA